MVVAFAGERGAYAEIAAREYFGQKVELLAVPEFVDVFEAVASGKCESGIVPLENSLAGSIHQNYDLLVETGLHIQGEIFLRISHCLIANKGVKKSQIHTVYSHPQALAQCKKYLKKLTKVKVEPTSNTAGAVKKIKDDQLTDAAAIGSMQAAINFDMQVLDANIEDNQWNTTRFIALSKDFVVPPKNKKIPMKSSIVFSTKNIPGALFKCLSVFALRDIDLYKIESRPVHGKGFEYMFYLDFAGDWRMEAEQNALNHLQEITNFFRLLGSYKVGKEIHPQHKK